MQIGWPVPPMTSPHFIFCRFLFTFVSGARMAYDKDALTDIRVAGAGIGLVVVDL